MPLSGNLRAIAAMIDAGPVHHAVGADAQGSGAGAPLGGRSEPSATLLFWTTGSMALGGSVIAAAQWVPVLPAHAPVLVGLTVTGFLGQLAIIEALRHGQASAVAPFEYSALAWAVALDWIVWRSVPDPHTLLGGAIIIASGVYLIRREAPKEMVVVPP
jgi:drug/metabolite transporter (DMT)-like permease